MTPERPTRTEKSAAFFIAGTDTSVGKSLVCSLLLGFFLKNGFKAGCQKWVSTGSTKPDDLLYCLNNNSMAASSLEVLAPYCFSLAASPHLAAEAEERIIDPEVIKKCLARARMDTEVLLVEGVGGVLVPLQRHMLLLDLVAGLDLPVILVARSGLGTLNHTLLSIEALKNRKISLSGIIFSDEQQYEPDDLLVNDNMRTIREMTGVSILGRLPRCSNYQEASRAFWPIGKKLAGL
ncbi:MAG: dethiobiotin synthase [Desulfurivibrionaceae bacterium]